MIIERLSGSACAAPFPVYRGLVDEFLTAHADGAAAHNATVAHVLAVCAGYSYSDAATVTMMMSRLGFDPGACVRVAQTVDAMTIFSTAYLVQSRSGRVVILAYRGTEPANIGNWLADADVGSAAMKCGDRSLRVHAGFYRNVRATRWQVIEELRKAAAGKSLLDDGRDVDHPMEALYVTGHSLGGAMAVLFALSIAGDESSRDLAARLRAIYTFGQPLTVGETLPPSVAAIGEKTFRHVAARDLIPALPAAAWGRLTHFGHEYRHAGGEWKLADAAVEQLQNLRELPRSIFAAFETVARKKPSRYSLADHRPHEYIERLRPPGRLSELGDDA